MEASSQGEVKVVWKQFPTLAKVKTACVLAKSIMNEDLGNDT
jgi:hypothetical protein